MICSTPPKAISSPLLSWRSTSFTGAILEQLNPSLPSTPCAMKRVVFASGMLVLAFSLLPKAASASAVEVDLDPVHSVEQVIGIDGGEVRTEDAQGQVYTLTIALMKPLPTQTEIPSAYSQKSGEYRAQMM